MSETPRTNDECKRRARLRVSAWNVSADFARELERELAQRTAERDEARREICESISAYAPSMSAKQIAAERGWDCFKKENK